MNTYICLLLLGLIVACTSGKKNTISLYLEDDEDLMILINDKIIKASSESISDILRGLKDYDHRATVDLYMKADSSLKSYSLLRCIDIVSNSGIVRVRFMDGRSGLFIGTYEIEGRRNIDKKFASYSYASQSSAQVSESPGIVRWDGIQVLSIVVDDTGAFLSGKSINEEKLATVLEGNRMSKVPTVVLCTVSNKSLAKDWIYLMKQTNEMSTATFPTKFVCEYQK